MRMDDDHNMLDGHQMASSGQMEVSPPRDGTPSSIGSSPEQDIGMEAEQEPAQPQKRKGGRKPIYATSEERKQRNRQAQAAFRERRTEYIKQLEANIKQNEDLLHSLQENHRRINNDCLMLRYKNSLLERILLEKGIDVQAELEMKQASPPLSAGMIGAVQGLSQPQPSQLQRTALQRQQARLTGSRGFLPKLAPGQIAGDANHATSPHAHPTPSSHASSPPQLSTRSPMVAPQGGMASPISLAQAQGQQFQAFPRAPQQPLPAHHPDQMSSPQSGARTLQAQVLPASGLSNGALAQQQSFSSSFANDVTKQHLTSAQSASSYYPSPFQRHYDQLEQEYDTQHSRSILDDPDVDEHQPHAPQPAGSVQETYAQRYGGQSAVLAPQTQQPSNTDYYHARQFPQQIAPQASYEQAGPLVQPTSHPTAIVDGQFSHNNIDPNDPLLDQDPFGLSASMHFPTPYGFDQQLRQNGPR